ncbi:MAG TPA: hypothetical protein VGL81_22220 [Polyangiaceae bacterium]
MTVAASNPQGRPAGAIMRTSLCGRGTNALFSEASTNFFQNTMAVSNDALYFVAYGPGDDLTQPLLRVPLGGGPSSILVSGYVPMSVGLDSTNLYWADGQAKTLMKLPLAGGTPVPLSESLGGDAIPQSLVVDPTGLYFWASTLGIERLPLGGGDTALLAASKDGVTDLAVSGGYVYWTSRSYEGSNPSGIMSVPVTGGTPTILSSDPAMGIAADGINVYWTVSLCGQYDQGQPCTGALKKMALGGGAPVTLTSGWSFQGFSAIAVDSTSIYWTSGDTVMRWTPK